MFISPEQFLEKYKEEGLPFFKIFKGQSTAEKSCITRFVDPMDLEGYDLLNEGAARLQTFFDMYQDGGNVNIMTKALTKNRDDMANVVHVKWGNYSAAVGSTRNTNTNMSYGNPMSQMNQFKEMFGFIGSMFKSQMESQVSGIKSDFTGQLEILKQQHRHEKEMEDVVAERCPPEPTIGQTLQTELLGLIRPVATNMMMNSATPPTPAVMGMESTAEAVPKTDTDTGTTKMHPMKGASMDLILTCVQNLATKVFPDFPINEVMPALIEKCIEQKDLIRGQVVPSIEKRRTATNQPKA